MSSITVTGESLSEIQSKLGLYEPSYAVTIRWRKRDYNHEPLPGCVIKYSNAAVPLEFTTFDAAIQSLEKFLLACKAAQQKQEDEKRATQKAAIAAAKDQRKILAKRARLQKQLQEVSGQLGGGYVITRGQLGSVGSVGGGGGSC